MPSHSIATTLLTQEERRNVDGPSPFNLLSVAGGEVEANHGPRSCSCELSDLLTQGTNIPLIYPPIKSLLPAYSPAADLRFLLDTTNLCSFPFGGFMQNAWSGNASLQGENCPLESTARNPPARAKSAASREKSVKHAARFEPCATRMYMGRRSCIKYPNGKVSRPCSVRRNSCLRFAQIVF